MKYRSDFVTNSSSSSFVIAINKKLTKKMLTDLIKKGKNEDGYAKDRADEIFETIIQYGDCIDLGDWKIFHEFDLHDGSDEYSNFSILCELESEYIKGKQSE